MAQNIYDNQNFFERYAQLNRSIHGLNGAPEWPSIIKMLPKMEGLNVVDLGCGYGWFCRDARQKGAKHVLGLDISERMLSKARETTTDNAIIYRQEDLEQLKLPEDTYDLAYSSLTLHYIEDLPKLLKTIYRSLKSGGYVVFSLEHPIYTAPKNPDWLIDKDGQKSWAVNNYQTEGQRITNWLVDGVIKQHRTIGTYLNMLIEQGFSVKYVEEWGPTSQQIVENPALNEEKERPMILLVSAQKPTNK
jgi:ubiquinone/menaquinone biosynthesis C-methylase UbiE